MKIINKIHLQKFRIHDNTKIEDVNDNIVLVGKNDIGKSSFLDALNVVFNYKKLDSNDLKLSCNYSELEILLGISDTSDNTFTVTTKVEQDLSLSRIQNNGNNAKDLLDSHYRYVLFPAENYIPGIEGYEQKTIQELLDIKCNAISDANTKKEMRKCWDEIFNDYKSDTLIAKHGTGVRRLCALFVFVADLVSEEDIEDKKYIVAIEEPEIALYPNQQRTLFEKLINVFNKLDVQLVITTHSPYIVKQLTEKDVFVLRTVEEKDDQGKVIKDADGKNKTTISSEILDDRILPYFSINQINYLAFEESSVEYHQELYVYIQGCLEVAVAGVNGWLINEMKIKNDTKFYNVDPKTGKLILNNPSKIATHGKYSCYNYTLPYCLRNAIDHPVADVPTDRDINEAYINNQVNLVTDKNLSDSIDIMIKAIQHIKEKATNGTTSA